MKMVRFRLCWESTDCSERRPIHLPPGQFLLYTGEPASKSKNRERALVNVLYRLSGLSESRIVRGWGRNITDPRVMGEKTTMSYTIREATAADMPALVALHLKT